MPEKQNQPPLVYLLATLDTKGPEAALVRDRLRSLGVHVVVVDTGCMDDSFIAADVTREEVFNAAGSSLQEMLAKKDRSIAVTKAAEGATAIVLEAFARGAVGGVIALGGSAGTTIGTAVMRTLPIGIPKVMVSTLASGDARKWVGDKDILMLNSVVDIAGINRISRQILLNAAAAMAGMVSYRSIEPIEDKPLIAATMFGVTTLCVQRARQVLEEAGYEVLVFHATGSGGQAMESLIREGLIAGVLDMTTTELADDLVGGVLSAGPSRLTAAAAMGVPQVVSVGATDMVNFWAPDTIPSEFKGRKFHRHNASVTLMRTTAEENAMLGQDIGHKVSDSSAAAAIILPLKGVSAIDREGEPFDDPQARKALFDAIRSSHGSVELIERDEHINDSSFAEAAARKLIQLLKAR